MRQNSEESDSKGKREYPILGLDLDGAVDEAPGFFGALSQCWPGKIVVITWRDDRTKAEAVLAALGVRYDDLVLVGGFAEKAPVIAEKGIDVYVDDQDEVLLHVPEGVAVLKIRNGGNYDFEARKWLFSSVTGKTV